VCPLVKTALQLIALAGSMSLPAFAAARRGAAKLLLLLTEGRTAGPTPTRGDCGRAHSSKPTARSSPR